MSKLYRGDRMDGHAIVSVDGRALPKAEHVELHSKPGFEWGYEGAGPLQLSLAICVCELGIEHGKFVYHDFMLRVVSQLPHNHWTLDSKAVRKHVEAIVLESERDEARRK